MTFECSLDLSAWSACESPQRYARLDPGAHSFRVRACDVAQNTDRSPAVRAWSLVVSRRRATVAGSAGADVIVGAPGNDLVRALGGNDVVYGGDGNDRLEGGVGADRLVGGRGRDTILGASGRDTIVARDGTQDTLDGGAGRVRARPDVRLDRLRSIELRF